MLAALLLAGTTLAPPTWVNNKSAPRDYVNKMTLKHKGALCGFVANQLPSADDSPYSYVYQEIIYGASGVKPTDSKPLRNSKVQKFWLDHGVFIKCKSAGFDVQNGALLKYAVARHFDSFVVNAVQWGLWLNAVDESDQRTVADYVRDEMNIAEQSSSPLFQKLKTYHILLRGAGAKYKSEMP